MALILAKSDEESDGNNNLQDLVADTSCEGVQYTIGRKILGDDGEACYRQSVLTTDPDFQQMSGLLVDTFNQPSKINGMMLTL